MIDTFFQDSLKVAEKAIFVAGDKSDSINVWMWVSIGELILIIGFILAKKLKKNRNAKQRFKKESLAQDVDFNNIIRSSFHSIELYDVLKVKCHPDRFPTDPMLNGIADKLFQEITKNKTNLKRLEELQIEAQQRLNINF